MIDDLKKTPVPARICDFPNRVSGGAIAQSADIDHRDRRTKLRRRCNRMVVEVRVVLTGQNKYFRDLVADLGIYSIPALRVFEARNPWCRMRESLA